LEIFLITCCKKNPLYEIGKMLKKTHLWLNHLPLLAHLIMIAPMGYMGRHGPHIGMKLPWKLP